MGWWKLPDGATMGDSAADAMCRLIDRVPTRPTLDQLLDAVEIVLRDAGPELVREPLIPSESIVAKTWPRHHSRPDDALVAHVRHGIQEIAETYREDLARPPTLRDLLAVIDFVLAPEFRELLTDPPAGEYPGLVIKASSPSH